MDAKDRQIIRVLQQNGRITNQDLANKVNLSPSPCLRRLRILEESGAICGYSTDADAQVYGLPVLVFVRIKLERHNEDAVKAFEAAIADMQNVLECYLMTGPADYLLKIVVADIGEYENLIRKRIHTIGCVGSIDTSFVYGTVKKTGVFPDI
jgi:Lrp/AsnC family leucine-responsive transcriptional regulator